MYWVLQSDIFTEPGFQHLVETLTRFDIPYSVHKVIPVVGVISPPIRPDGTFDNDIEFDENFVVELPPGPKIVLGSSSMSAYALRRGWTPGSFVNENHDFRAQVQHWREYMVNGDAEVMRFAEVPKTREMFFIRPVDDSKAFAGHVTGWGKFREWQQRVLNLGADNGATLDGDTLVMVSGVKTILREYRLWVVDHRVVTASLYKEGSRVRYDNRVDERVIAFGSGFVGFDKWEPARAYCLDIFETDKGLEIGEVNCINSAGFYAADMQKLVDALERMYPPET